jgi:hypothetical protein
VEASMLTHKTITGIFDSDVTAELATHVLKRFGFQGHEISVLSSDSPYVDEEAPVGEYSAGDSGGVLVGVSAPEDLVDVAKHVLRSSGATSIEVS